MIVEFPSSKCFGINEWNIHIKFLIRNFELNNYKVIYNNDFRVTSSGLYPIKINNKLIYIDYADSPDNCWYQFNGNIGGKRYKYEDIVEPIFKRCMHVKFNYPNNIIPSGPLYTKDVAFIENLINKGNIYKPVNNIIIHTGKTYCAGAYGRKTAFEKIDHNKLNSDIKFDRRFLKVQDHWSRFNNCISSLNISGATKYTLDPGMLEPMLLGVCIIANNIDSYLPYNEKINSELHYICLKDDFSNINECINYACENKQECKNRGEAIYELLHKTCEPEPLINWIVEKTEEYYE